MAKIDFYVPEPSDVYNKDTQRQIIQAIDTLKTQLNTSYSEETKEEISIFEYFMQ
jgi:hypothetical protein